MKSKSIEKMNTFLTYSIFFEKQRNNKNTNDCIFLCKLYQIVSGNDEFQKCKAKCKEKCKGRDVLLK